MSRAAAVDLGSNMLRLAVGSLDSHGVMTIERKIVEVTRVAEGIEATGRFGPVPIARTGHVLAAFARCIEESGVDRVAAVATGAFRLAKNRADARRTLSERLGAPVEIITGDREAALARRGIRAAHGLAASARIAVLDIGGTSTELVLENDADEPATASIPTGVVNLTERARAATVALEDVDAWLAVRADEAIAAFPDPDGRPRRWFTAGGAAVALAAFELRESLPEFTGDGVTTIDRAELARIYSAFAASTSKERIARLGVTEAHAGLVPAGYAILEAALTRFAVTAVCPTGRGVVEGRLDELLRE